MVPTKERLQRLADFSVKYAQQGIDWEAVSRHVAVESDHHSVSRSVKVEMIALRSRLLSLSVCLCGCMHSVFDEKGCMDGDPNSS